MFPASFRSQVDIWFIGPSLIFLGISAGAIVQTVLRGPSPAALVLFAAMGLWAWLAFGTHYVVTNKNLVVRSGPLKRTVTLESIQSVRATRAFLSAPALSMNRIELSVRGGSPVVISPVDRPRFLSILASMVPGVSIEGLSVNPVDNAATTRRVELTC